MFHPMQKTKLASVMLICFLFSGCSLASVDKKLKVLDNKIGEGLKKIQEEKIDNVLNSFNEIGQNTTSIEIDINNLTIEQEKKIDLWLKEKNLNRYGDPVDTFYTGGTPLFDEKTGLSIERYDYILKNHPEIIEYLQKE